LDSDPENLVTIFKSPSVGLSEQQIAPSFKDFAHPREILYWGSVPVPYAALWTGEAGGMHIAVCPYAKTIACCDTTRRGSGKPVFGKPHMGRQRELITNDLCDLCAKHFRNRTRVSLSHARAIATGGQGPCVMQVEPMVHKDCALICVEHCPSLKRDIERGTLFVRQVLKHRHQFAILTEAAVEEFCGERRGGVIGHAKVELQRWIDRDLSWLQAARGAPHASGL
jgi:hypothetical protein